MAPPVLCLLFVSLLHLSSIHPAVSSAGLQVRGHQVGRKLFDESTSSSSSSSDSSSSSSSSSDSGSSSTPSDSGSSSSSSSSDSGASSSSSSSSDTVQVNEPTEFTPVPENPAPSPKSPSPAPKSTAPTMKASNTTIIAPPKAALSPPPTPWFLGGSSLSDSSFAGYSYAFPSDILNFTDAEVYCRKTYKNGHLVSIHSQAQQDFLNQKYVQGTAVNFLSVLVPQQYPPNDGVGHRGVWIGLQTTGDKQGWTDGTPYDYDSFLAGKPDNWQGIEGCVQIYGDTTPVGWSGFWDDISCESKMRFICAWPILDSKDTAYPVYNGSMYIYHSEIATWETAESTCWKLDNGHLVSIHSKQQADWIWQTFVFPKKTVDFSVQLPIVYQQDPNAMVTSHRGIWIGLNLQRSTPYWTDFSPYDYKDWAPSQPDNWNNIEFCTSLYVDAAPKGYQTKWDDLACEAQLPFLCTRPVNQSDEVYPQYKGWEYIMMNEAMTWMAANRSCVDKYDAQVVSFDSQEELSFVYSQYFQVASNNYPVLLPSIYTDPSNLAAVNQSYRGIGRRGVWIGLINRDSGVWQWSDGSSSTFKAWVPGKPDNFLSAESCTQLYIDSKPTGWASYWDDLACTALCSAICKRRPRKTAVQAPSGVENPYAQEILPYMNTTPIAADAVISDATLPNATFMSKKTSSMSKRSVIALAVVGGFIGLLVLSSIVWHFLRPSNNEEEVVAAGAAAAGAGVAALPNNYKGKAKATGVVHAPTGTGRLPPAKVAATREARPSKYVKINVEDLEVPPENFTFPPTTVQMEHQHEVMHKH